MTKVIKWLFVASSLIILFFSIALCFVFFSIDYDTFTNQTLALADKGEWKDFFVKSVFPPSHFEWLRVATIPFIFFNLFFSFFVIKNIAIIAQKINTFLLESYRIIRSNFTSKNKTEKHLFLAIFMLFALRGLWQIYHYELQYDEAWTYNHFVSKGFIVSIISPNNNHIFYTILASWADYLPLVGKYTLRLPVWLGGLIASSFFYVFIRKYFGWKWAIISFATFAFSPAISFYSMYARAYIFQILFTIIALAAMAQIINNQKAKYYWIVWAISNILGIYSLPTHLYAWVAFNLIFIYYIYNKSICWRAWFKANTIILSISFILFFPFLITNGWRTLVGAATRDATHNESFFNYQNRVADWLLVGGGRGTNVYWFIALIGIVLIILVFKKNKNKSIHFFNITTLVFLALPTAIALILGTQTPYRAWCFLSPFLVLIIPIIGSYFPAIKTPKTIIILLFFGSLSFWRSEVHYFIHWSQKLDQEALKISKIMLKNKIKECYFFSNYDKPLLEYYYLRNHQKLQTKMIGLDSKNYAPFVNAPIYESVCWDKEDFQANQGQIDWLHLHYDSLLYQNDRIEIWLKKL